MGAVGAIITLPAGEDVASRAYHIEREGQANPQGVRALGLGHASHLVVALAQALRGRPLLTGFNGLAGPLADELASPRARPHTVADVDLEQLRDIMGAHLGTVAR